MKIFSVSQIKAWDAYTIQHEPVSSVELMERAASACATWIISHFEKNQSFKIFCGKGNNGGDGLAIARILLESGYPVSAYIVDSEKPGSSDFEINLERLHKISNEIYFLKDADTLPGLTNETVIDAIFGTGLNKRVTGLFSTLIHHLNKFAQTIISIDVPSGLLIDESSAGRGNNEIIKANYTLSFQNQKRGFLMAENGLYTGEVFLLDINLSKEFEEKEDSALEFVDKGLIKRLYVPRNSFANKGNYGYACLLSGSYGMMGAAVLSSRACLRSGVGKLTCYTCKSGYEIVQSCVPEAMCKTSGNTFIKDITDFKNFDIVGIGPGIGRHISHKQLLHTLFTSFKKPVVVDADALNVMSENPTLYKLIPENSIITPHPKEFERLFGKSASDFERIELAIKKAKQLHIFVVLKGHFSFIAAPDGKGYFNSTGNAGMATAGSGDVLTGIITGLVAQKYAPLSACILGVYLHGLAGDLAAKKISEEGLIAGDIINYLGKAFKEISSK
ncbi:MAG TPA: NAD(P)H-hydrate dehydratase [Hanamia sp.]|nr:NAD(P)H-hydrate dehydratase [Hanamia sp.]